MPITYGYTNYELIISECLKEVVIVPWFDRTGPNGMGPLTGRRRGRCVSSNMYQAGYGRRYTYLLPAVSLLYRLGKRYVLPPARRRLNGIWSKQNRK